MRISIDEGVWVYWEAEAKGVAECQKELTQWLSLRESSEEEDEIGEGLFRKRFVTFLEYLKIFQNPSKKKINKNNQNLFLDPEQFLDCSWWKQFEMNIFRT